MKHGSKTELTWFYNCTDLIEICGLGLFINIIKLKLLLKYDYYVT